MAGPHEVDLEKNPPVTQASADTSSDGAVPGESFAYGNSLYAKIQRLAGKFQIEQRGIERVPAAEQTDTSYLNVGSMWLAANMVVSSFAIGALALPVYNLGFVDAILTLLFFNLLGIMTVCFFSTFGPFGLRQMVFSRFWFGWWATKFFAILNILACMGWSAANTIVGAQMINAVNEDVPGFAAVLIIAICTLLVTFAGYKVVHMYEYWSWIPTSIVFLIVLGCFAHSGDFYNIPMKAGSSEMGSVLSFGSAVYGYATGWTSYAADYTVYQPANASKRKIFFSCWIGLIVPLLFIEMLGVAIMTATTIDGGNNKYQLGYDATGNGGLVGAVLDPLGGFGKFCLVILGLSIVANNCPNIYSVALTVQVLSRYAQRVPRFIWTLAGTGVSIAIAIPGYSHFEDVLENFMNFIAYWLAIYSGIALTDHFVFKRGFGGYAPEDYDKPNKQPPGIAAALAFAFGVAGMVTGMSQQWADWADDEEFDDPSSLPAQQITTNKDGTKTVVSYRFNDEGKKVKVTRRIKTTTVREHVNPQVAERKTWAKFGLEKGHAAGPSFDTTSVGENIIFRPSINWKAQAAEAEKNGGEKGSIKDQLKDKKVKCRICSGEHFTARCPFKDTMAPVDEGGAGGEGGAAGGDEDAAGGLGAGGGSYVPPHMRKGAAGGGERMAGKYEKDDLATLRVTNVSELAEEQELRDLFERFGRVTRVFLARDRETQRAKGFAFISFADRSDAARACDKMDGFGYRHLILRVEFAKRAT
ncbi:eukaryotic translation initiation factor 3 subunit G-domain-containing protein [Aspergillus stella-maris]|uniref:eukaryotic translation initiation factor 3 subunit G-domain-containing protein n=1 Tax=Aspergillus stella-maris TaxID=1810926 RepID=UPI003CCD302B